MTQILKSKKVDKLTEEITIKIFCLEKSTYRTTEIVYQIYPSELMDYIIIIGFI